RWFRTKETVLQCIEFCGLPNADITVAQIPKFAELVARIAADPKIAERLAGIVEKRDAAAYKAFVTELKVGPLCQFLCHWVCSIHWRLVCEIICEPRPVPRKLATELVIAGTAVANLAKNQTQLQAVIPAAVAFNCELLKNSLGDFNDC